MDKLNIRGPEKGVWIASPRIENNGIIHSEGEGALTTLISDNLKNNGIISTKDMGDKSKEIKKKWYLRLNEFAPWISIVVDIFKSK